MRGHSSLAQRTTLYLSRSETYTFFIKIREPQCLDKDKINTFSLSISEKYTLFLKVKGPHCLYKCQRTTLFYQGQITSLTLSGSEILTVFIKVTESHCLYQGHRTTLFLSRSQNNTVFYQGHKPTHISTLPLSMSENHTVFIRPREKHWVVKVRELHCIYQGQRITLYF